MSARCRRSATSSPCSGASATPALAVTARVEPVDLDRAGVHFVQLMRRCAIASGVGDVGDDQGELVPPSRATVASSVARGEALGDLAEEAVADGVTQRVVHILEAVEVEEDDGDATLIAGRGGAGSGRAFGSAAR